MLVLDRSQSGGQSQWNDYVVPFAESLAESIIAASTGSTRVGLVVYPSQSGASTGDTAGNAKILAQPSTSASTITSLTSAVGSGCKGNPKNSLKYPCGGWKFSPMWRGLQEAEDAIYPNGVAQRAHQAVVVVSDGVPYKSQQKNRATWLTLTAANSIKSRGAKIIGVGFGSEFTGALGGTEDCAPFSCSSSAGGSALFVGTDPSAGTVHFSSVDTSSQYCNGDAGCGTMQTVTLDALVSGSTAAEKTANSYGITDANALSGIIGRCRHTQLARPSFECLAC